MEQFESRYVIEEIAGHPGSREYVIVGSRDDLIKLGTTLASDVESGSIRMERQATLASSAARVGLTFRVTSDKEISDFHVPTLYIRLAPALRIILMLGVVSFALFGVITLLRR